MTRIANCRKELYKDAYPYGYRHEPADEKNPYWQGFLNDENKKVIEGYDMAVNEVLNSAVCNVADGKWVNFIVPEIVHRELENLFDKLISLDKELTREKFAELCHGCSPATMAMAAVWLDIMEQVERSRNEIITSMIDGQEENDNE